MNARTPQPRDPLPSWNNDATDDSAVPASGDPKPQLSSKTVWLSILTGIIPVAALIVDLAGIAELRALVPQHAERWVLAIVAVSVYIVRRYTDRPIR